MPDPEPDPDPRPKVDPNLNPEPDSEPNPNTVHYNIHATFLNYNILDRSGYFVQHKLVTFYARP